MLTVIIPAYNEEKVIQKTIDDIFEWSTTSLLEIILVIINNNSTDSTESILKKNSLEKRSLIYKNEEKQGKGFAIKAGLALASNSVLILDADLSVSIDQFQTKWLELENTAISGSRFMGKVQGTPARRLLTGKGFSWIVKKYFNMTVDDTQYIKSKHTFYWIDIWLNVFDLNEKNIIIIGGNKGIGFAYAESLL